VKLDGTPGIRWIICHNPTKPNARSRHARPRSPVPARRGVWPRTGPGSHAGTRLLADLADATTLTGELYEGW